MHHVSECPNINQLIQQVPIKIFNQVFQETETTNRTQCKKQGALTLCAGFLFSYENSVSTVLLKSIAAIGTWLRPGFICLHLEM